MATTGLQKYEKYGESRMTELVVNDLTSKRDLCGKLKLSARPQVPPAVDPQTLASEHTILSIKSTAVFKSLN